MDTLHAHHRMIGVAKRHGATSLVQHVDSETPLEIVGRHGRKDCPCDRGSAGADFRPKAVAGVHP